MKKQCAVVLAVALLFTGCYQSDKELFHIVDGEEVPLQKGIHTCMDPKGKRMHFDVTVEQVGTSYRYVLAEVKVGKKKGPPGTFTFHEGPQGVYFLASQAPPKPGSVKQSVAIVRWKGEKIEWVLLKNDAKNQALAKKHGVTMGAEWKISGPVAKQHEFLRAAAAEKDLTTFMTCQRDLR